METSWPGGVGSVFVASMHVGLDYGADGHGARWLGD